MSILDSLWIEDPGLKDLEDGLAEVAETGEFNDVLLLTVLDPFSETDSEEGLIEFLREDVVCTTGPLEDPTDGPE